MALAAQRLVGPLNLCACLAGSPSSSAVVPPRAVGFDAFCPQDNQPDWADCLRRTMLAASREQVRSSQSRHFAAPSLLLFFFLA